MRALVADGAGSVGVEHVADPKPNAGEVVVAVKAAGICGSDLHLVDGDNVDARYPLILGHEFAGEVVASNSSHGPAVGARVAVDPSLYCQSCRYCRDGKANLCDRRGALGVTVPGGLAEYVSVPSANLHLLPEGTPYTLGALVEPLSCVVRGLDRLDLRYGSVVLVVGAGAIGLMMVRALLAGGAALVAVVDSDPRRLPAATAFGAHLVGTNADELVESVGRGFDYVVECAGSARAAELAIAAADKGGTVLLFGVPPQAAEAKFLPHEIYRKELTIVGSMAILDSFPRAVSAAVRDRDVLPELVTHRFGIGDAVHALSATRERLGLKIQITFE